MFLDEVRNIRHALPSTTEEIKWESDLCFNIGEKMYGMTSLETPSAISMKVKGEEFEEISSRSDSEPAAPYLARYHWVLIKSPQKLSREELEALVRQSYELIKSRLPEKSFLNWALRDPS
ncbi:MAG: hypothetical protein C5B59_13125 [Bacteroidetes bacterium]|nr:MAG: hypothetical protein C5B59_13125 [Bacteroidota bacterium]